MKFKKAYDVTTKIGGYLNEENVASLQRCLKGEARESVSSLLITATNAGQIIDTLQMRFGNPDVIVQKTIQRLRKLPKAGAGSADIIVLVTELQNAVASMEALQHIGYLYSPEIAQEMLSKFPSSMISLYNKFAADAPVPQPRLVTISNIFAIRS